MATQISRKLQIAGSALSTHIGSASLPLWEQEMWRKGSVEMELTSRVCTLGKGDEILEPDYTSNTGAGTSVSIVTSQ